MNNITANQFPIDKVRICKEDICIEARGNNAEMITGALAIALLCIGIAALTKAN
jgi:hypothetical protein